ncbi:MAG: tRNA (cytosine(32)/uridine(32)-2'-O)-methyltransferase TrmJ [Acidobacteria bacterium]|nr:tRNA (cytosine(32)/uridine(32)-2'-O)-methyltransferase TrmJ [Acidobacteriota bacterium]
MPCAAVILVETSAPGNLGAAMRAAANFGVPRLILVRPGATPADESVLRWACGAQEHLEIVTAPSLPEAAAPFTTVIGTASGRGRKNLPVIGPAELVRELEDRTPGGTALVFGNETRGLRREDLDRCDLVVRIPTAGAFPVLNLAQSIAILLGHLTIATQPAPATSSNLATNAAMEALMAHMKEALLDIGFLDPVNPERILRKLRRLLGRAGVTGEEVTILHGICRQTLWASDRARRDDHDPS